MSGCARQKPDDVGRVEEGLLNPALAAAGAAVCKG